MKKQYLMPATQAQSMIAAQVFMSSPMSLGRNDEGIGGTGSEDIIYIE